MQKWLKAILGFFSRLSKREKMILYIVVLFVAVALLDRLIISPISYKIGSLDDEIQGRESQVRRDMKILTQKDRILAESAKYAPYLKSVKSEEEEMTSILKEIETLANKDSVYIVDMKPGGVKSAGDSRKYVVNLNCEAQMEQLGDFMYDIEDSKKLLTIERFQINPKSKESSVAKCSMAIAKIALY